MNKLFGVEDSIKQGEYSKVKIAGISNKKFRNQYVFESSQHFFEFLRRFLKNLGFTNEDFWINSIGRPSKEDDDEVILDMEFPIGHLNSLIENYRNKHYSVDVFYTEKRVCMIINYRNEKHYEIVNAIEDLVDWGDDDER